MNTPLNPQLVQLTAEEILLQEIGRGKGESRILLHEYEDHVRVKMVDTAIDMALLFHTRFPQRMEEHNGRPD